MYIPEKTTLSADSYTILNTIRQAVGGEFRASTPLVQNASDAQAYGLYVTGAGDAHNAFMQSLINRIAQVMCLVKSYDNHLKKFKRGILSAGEVIENVWIGLVLPEGFTQSVSNPGDCFEINNPSNQTTMHPVNSKLVYKITRNNDELMLAITSDLYGFVAKIVEQLYNSAFWDEEIMMKYVLERAIIDNWDAVKVEVPVLTKDSAVDVMTVMKETSMDMEWMNDAHNIMSVPTSSPIEDQFFFLTNKAAAIIDNNALAMAYNLEYRQFIGQREKINSFVPSTIEQNRLDHIMSETVAQGLVPGYTAFTTAEKEKLASICAVTLDKDFLFIFDKLFRMTSIFDPLHLNDTIFLHIWKVYSYNPFAQIAVYVETSG